MTDAERKGIQEREALQEDEPCRDCEYLSWCREKKRPQRTSCSIRMFRKYWAQQLGTEAAVRKDGNPDD